MKTSNTFLRVGLFLILLTTTGCIPGITWLPDSSGFIYTSEHQSLVHFDVAKGKKRTIVEDTEAATTWPAVSPDGKQVAVARLTREKGKADILQVIIYGMNGKVIRQSSPFIFSEAGAANDQNNRGGTMLFWGPLNNQIIIFGWPSDKPKSAVYDVKNNRVSIVSGTIPAAFGGNPIRPDGKGFIVSKFGVDKNFTGMSFIDRQGKEHDIVLKPEAVDSQDKLDMLVFPFLRTSSWEGNKAVVFNAKWRFEIDTERFVGKIVSSPQGQPNKGKELRQQFAFPNTSKVVRVWKGLYERLEIFDSLEKKSKTLIEEADGCDVFPSPNRKLAAVRCFDAETKEGKQSELILVINQKGEVVARTAKKK